MRIAHIITRMIIGGAQENTLFNCQDLIQLFGDDVLLMTGPALGPEGDLLGQGRGGQGGGGPGDPGHKSFKVPVTIIPSLRRSIDPWRDTASYFAIKQAL